MRNIFFILTISLSLSSSLSAQYNTNDLDMDQDVSVWFDTQLGLDQTPLVLGTFQHIQMSPNSHPFYKERHWTNGALKYRGEIFLDVNMRYNTFQDFLIILHPNNQTIANQPIRLDVNQLEWFSVLDKSFMTYPNLESKPGIYQVLYKGNSIDFVAKRRKKETMEDQASRHLGYVSDDKYFLIHNDKISPIRNKSGFTRPFPMHKKNIKNQINQSGLKVNTKNEQAMIEAAIICDQTITGK